MIMKVTITALLAGQVATAALIIPRDVVTVTSMVTDTVWAFAPTGRIHHTSVLYTNTTVTKTPAAPTVKPGFSPIDGLPASPEQPIVIVPLHPTVIDGTTTYVPSPTLSSSDHGQAAGFHVPEPSHH